MTYILLNQNEYSKNDYKLIPLRREDIGLIKDWRNAQIDVLRQRQLLKDTDQYKYFQNIVLPSFKEKYPEQILFSFLLQDKCIGYGGLVHISWENKRAEVSFLLNTQRTLNKILYEKDFKSFLLLIKEIAFNELRLNRIYTETFDIRDHHIKILEGSGFNLEGRMRKHTLIHSQFIDSLIHGCVKTDMYEK